MRLADVKSYYGQRYTSIFNTFNNHFKNIFDFDIDEFGVNLDLTLIDESIDMYIYLRHDGSKYQICFNSKNIEYTIKSFSTQLSLSEYLDMLLYKLYREE